MGAAVGATFCQRPGDGDGFLPAWTGAGGGGGVVQRDQYM